MAGGGLALAAAVPLRSAWATASTGYQVTAASSQTRLRGAGKPDTAVWAYNGQIPGPVLRARQGEPMRIVVQNKLDQDTTVHWHGLRLPNAMDGVPGLTQPSIAPGESFTYEFTPPDAGTFWYHPHAHSLQQLGRGLAGALIIDEAEPVAVDRDRLWVLTDWRLKRDGQIAAGFGNMMDAGMAGRVGNTITLNGSLPSDQMVRAGERLRLRLVNTALARIMALRFEGHRPSSSRSTASPATPTSRPMGVSCWARRCGSMS